LWSTHRSPTHTYHVWFFLYERLDDCKKNIEKGLRNEHKNRYNQTNEGQFSKLEKNFQKKTHFI
jgi:hypothetical protein